MPLEFAVVPDPLLEVGTVTEELLSLCDIILPVNRNNAHLSSAQPGTIPPSAQPGTIPPVEEFLCSAIEKAAAAHQLFPPGRALVVGVSGGADSVCLLHLLLRYAAIWELDLQVAHLDHALRPDSAEDAAFVASLAEQWGALFHLRQLAPGELAATGENIEAAARQARYQFLAEVARDVRSSASQPATVAVAHTADDQAETLLLNLLRGSGLNGLSAMRMRTLLSVESGESSRPEEPIWLVRPFLGVSRTQILRYLAIYDLPWREDPTNLDLHYTRNWLRHEILPRLATYNPNVQAALNRTAALLAAEAERAERINRAAFEQLVEQAYSEPAHSRVVLDLAAFLAQDVATQRGVLRQAWRHLAAPSDALTFAHIEAVRQSLPAVQGNAGPVPVAAAIAWSVVGGHFCLHRAADLPLRPQYPFLDAGWQSAHGRLPLSIPGTHEVDGWQLCVEEFAIQDLAPDWRAHGPWRAYLDRDAVGQLTLTTPQQAQRFAPLGMGGQQKFLGDLFTDRKTHPSLRPGWPLILNSEDNRVLWVCGIQIAHPARITEGTRRVVHLWWEKV
jgi:tRNA(Ile)-lysidine synthase